MIKVFELEPIYTYTYIISGSESTHAKDEIAFYVVPERIYRHIGCSIPRRPEINVGSKSSKIESPGKAISPPFGPMSGTPLRQQFIILIISMSDMRSPQKVREVHRCLLKKESETRTL
ncbi:hypothetical protein BDE02_T001900 [Populus trichocarpa]|nr:hypothetical protein BDE02_T001900 [Populus trichocarpa]